MGLWIEFAARLQIAALYYHFTGRILDCERHPTFVHVALLRHVTMRHTFVLQDDGNGHFMMRSEGEGFQTEWGDHRRRRGIGNLYAENINVEHSFFQELRYQLPLLFVLVVERHQSIGT